jgi:hypothetical protein
MSSQMRHGVSCGRPSAGSRPGRQRHPNNHLVPHLGAYALTPFLPPPLRLRAARARSVQDRLADAITAFSGRMVWVYVYIVWFGVWLVLNTGRVGVRPFDEESIDQDQCNTSEHGYSVEHVHLMARSCGPLCSAVGRRPLLGAISWSGTQ